MSTLILAFSGSATILKLDPTLRKRQCRSVLRDAILWVSFDHQKYGPAALKGMSMADIRVHTFTNLFPGLPAGGPFDLKLLAWLNLAGIPYDQEFQNDTRKGPKGKNPWIEFDGQRIGDTEIIIDHLGAHFGIDLDGDFTTEQRAIGHAWRRTFEEHFHQVFEWELLVHPAGAEFMRAFMVAEMPMLIGPMVFRMMRGSMNRQLHARGIGRHTPEIISAKGRKDIDALSAFLGDRDYLIADKPALADLAVFGQLAPMMVWPMKTPVAQYARRVPNVAAYCERMQARCFASGPDASTPLSGADAPSL